MILKGGTYYPSEDISPCRYIFTAVTESAFIGQTCLLTPDEVDKEKRGVINILTAGESWEVEVDIEAGSYIMGIAPSDEKNIDKNASMWSSLVFRLTRDNSTKFDTYYYEGKWSESKLKTFSVNLTEGQKKI